MRLDGSCACGAVRFSVASAHPTHIGSATARVAEKSLEGRGRYQHLAEKDRLQFRVEIPSPSTATGITVRSPGLLDLRISTVW
jgi:hypothetical protein